MKVTRKRRKRIRGLDRFDEVLLVEVIVCWLSLVKAIISDDNMGFRSIDLFDTFRLKLAL